MKSQKGITIATLSVYVAAMTIIIAIISVILSFYNKNIVTMNDTGDINIELNKFTTKMIQETQEPGNSITDISTIRITFNSGNTYTFQDNRIYQNTIEVANNVKEFTAKLETEGEKQILRIYIVLGKGKVEIVKNLSYVIGGQGPSAEVDDPNYVLEYEPLPDVYGNLYKISETEYHLIFNTTGEIAKGYTESQLVARGTNIKDGSGSVRNSEGVYQSTQPWGVYSDKITKVKIEETIKPNSALTYFIGLSKITEIEGIERFDTSNVTSMRAMFFGCSSLKSLDVSGFNTSKVTSMLSMFNKCSSLKSLDVSGFDTSNVTSMYCMFEGCSGLTNLDISNFNTGNVVDMTAMFFDCNNLTSIDVSRFNTSKVTDMHSMFYNCDNLTSIDVSNFNTSKVTSMQSMFENCKSITSLDLSGFNTQNVTSMKWMFLNCNNLKSLNISNFNTSKINDMQAMFCNCNSLTSIDVSSFNTSKVTNMQSMFENCKSITSLDLSRFNTQNVTSMKWMFLNCFELTSLDLSSFNTGKVTDMYRMFADCIKIKTIYAGEKWTTSSVTESTEMFSGCKSLKGMISYDSTKLDATYANYTNGYLTYKASQ